MAVRQAIEKEGAVFAAGHQSSHSRRIWSDGQVACNLEFERLRKIAHAEFKTLISYTSEFEKDVHLSIVNWLHDVYTNTLVNLIAPDLPEILVSGVGRVLQEGTEEIVDREKIRIQQKAVNEMVAKFGLHALLTRTADMVSWSNCGADWKLVWSKDRAQPSLILWQETPGYYAYEECPLSDPQFVQARQYWYPVTKTTTYQDGSKHEELFYVCERHSLRRGTDGTVLGLEITNKAYRTNDEKIPTVDEVPVASVWPDEADAPEPAYWHEGLTQMLGYRIWNVNRTTDYTTALINLQENWILDNTQRQVVIRLLEQPMLDLPTDMIDPVTGRPKEGLHIILQQNGETSEKIKINAWSGGLKDSAQQIDILMRQMYLHVCLSPILLGEELAANESGVSRALAMHQSVTAVKQRRVYYNGALAWLVNAGMQLQIKFGRGKIEPVEALDIHWPVVLPEDEMEQSQVNQAERQMLLAEYKAGARSLIDYISHLHNTETEIRLEFIRLAVEGIPPATPEEKAEAFAPVVPPVTDDV